MGVVTDRDPQVSRLYATIATVLDVDERTLDDESSPDSVPAWDSLNHLNMAMSIETEFGVAFTAEEVMDMRTVGHMRAALKAHGVEI